MSMAISARMPDSVASLLRLVPAVSPGDDASFSRLEAAVADYENGLDVVDRIQAGAKANAASAKSLKLDADKARLQALKLDALIAAAGGDVKRAKAIAKDVAAIAKELNGLMGGSTPQDLATAGATADGAAAQAEFAKEVADAAQLAGKIIDFLRRAFSGRRRAAGIAQPTQAVFGTFTAGDGVAGAPASSSRVTVDVTA